MKIGVVGLGKLGMPWATLLSQRNEVYGFDLNEDVVRSINEGVCPVQEPGLAELFVRHPFTASTNFTDIDQTQVSFVVVPTPSAESTRFSNEFVVDAVQRIGKALRDSSHWHLVVIVSTVMPGDSDGAIRYALEEAASKTVGGELLSLAYSPEFIALGEVIHGMENPDMILIGESDFRAGNALELVQASVVKNKPPVVRMSLVNAEIAKLSVNSYVTMKISFANAIGEFCERVVGGDARVVSHAIGLDSRIGGKYLQAATSYGGPCFPRDSRALGAFAQGLGLDSPLARAADEVNWRQVPRLADRICEFEPTGLVGVLGLSYKPFTSVFEESPGVAMVHGLRLRGRDVLAFDPMAQPPDIDQVDVSEMLEWCGIIVVMTPWPEFADIQFRNQTVVDCWNIIKDENTAGLLVRVGVA